MRQSILFLFAFTVTNVFSQLDSKFVWGFSYSMPMENLKEPVLTYNDFTRLKGNLIAGISTDMGGTIYPHTFFNDIVLGERISIGFDFAVSASYFFGRKLEYDYYPAFSGYVYENLTGDTKKNHLILVGGKIGPAIGLKLARNIYLDLMYRLNPSAIWFPVNYLVPLVGTNPYTNLPFDSTPVSLVEETYTFSNHFILQHGIAARFRFGGLGLGIEYNFGEYKFNEIATAKLPIKLLNFQISMCL